MRYEDTGSQHNLTTWAKDTSMGAGHEQLARLTLVAIPYVLLSVNKKELLRLRVAC